MRVSRFLLRFASVCLLLGVWGPAHAVRPFPPEVQRGELAAHDYPMVKIGVKVYRLAPGARIFDRMNTLIVPTMLPRRREPVLFTVDFNGHLSNLWLPTGEELRRFPQKK